MLETHVEVMGLEPVQRAIARLGDRFTPNSLRRPAAFVGAEMVVRTKRRLGQGVDVHGMPLKSQRSRRLGLKPLGGADGDFGKSVHWAIASDGVDLYSTFVGAGVAQRGDTITPKRAKYLTIPLRARGGDNARADRALTLVRNRTGRRAAHYLRTTTFIRRTAGGKLIIFQKEPSGAIRALFLLLKKVRYPKNEWLGYSADDQKMAVDQFAKFLGDAFTDGGSR